jgi:opacity protein-like surface antigen
MKKSLSFLAAVMFMSAIHAQNVSTNEQEKKGDKPGIGLKAGYNISYANGVNTGFNPGKNNGFMIAGFYGLTGKSIIGYRSEIVFSRQGYTYDDAGSNTEVMNDYIYLPHFLTVNVTKYLQLQAGMQIGYLLNAKKSGTEKSSDSSMMDFMNRVDYGFAGGIEINPIKGLILGARYNHGLGKMYKQYEGSATNPSPFPLPFDPATTNLKNAGVQIFIGYKF